jgi:hypothetical protein
VENVRQGGWGKGGKGCKAWGKVTAASTNVTGHTCLSIGVASVDICSDSINFQKNVKREKSSFHLRLDQGAI